MFRPGRPVEISCGYRHYATSLSSKPPARQEGLSPETLSLSIADTRVTKNQEDIQSTATSLSVNVPASQIGPVAVEQFCTAESIEQEGRLSLRLSSVLSAQSSLLCVGDKGNDMTYASASLDIVLQCEDPEEAEDGPSPRR